MYHWLLVLGSPLHCRLMVDLDSYRSVWSPRLVFESRALRQLHSDFFAVFCTHSSQIEGSVCRDSMIVVGSAMHRFGSQIFEIGLVFALSWSFDFSSYAFLAIGIALVRPTDLMFSQDHDDSSRYDVTLTAYQSQ